MDDSTANPEPPRPGAGVGYPVPYNGERLEVNLELLSKCKMLAEFSGAYRLNDEVVLKTGEAVRPAEALTMQLVREKTTIPVPRVLSAHVQEGDGRGVILMEYVEGETLDKAWPQLSHDQKHDVESELQKYMTELKSVRQSYIGAVDQSRCADQFFAGEGKPGGPFPSESEFHEALADVVRQRGDNSAWHNMVADFMLSLQGYETVLTHNDLAPRNILVRDGKIVAILDWELSGYYPSYWEYIKAYLWNDWNSSWIKDRIPDRIMQPFLHELAHLLHARDVMW